MMLTLNWPTRDRFAEGSWSAWPNISYTEVLTFGTFIFATAQAWYKHYYKGDEWMATLAAFPAKKATK